jgi:IclR family transcriptional regulator, KDG regulon repressor
MDTTVVKGMRVLELLARAEGPMRLSSIAEALQLQKSNVHRLLNTLSQLGYVRRDAGTGFYQATLSLWELGAGIIAAHPAKRAAGPFMQEIHLATAETVSLTILDGDEVLYLDKILAPRPLRFTTQPGSRASAPLTASGKVMLAFEPAEVAEATIRRVVATVTQARDLNVEDLLDELALVRRQGYATSESSWTSGVVSIAAAIMGRDGRAAAALTVSGPAERLTPEARANAAEAVMHACTRIAETFGRI